nr:MAG TPA: hypothetical protein [Caudoviricetes sp.]
MLAYLWYNTHRCAIVHIRLLNGGQLHHARHCRV